MGLGEINIIAKFPVIILTTFDISSWYFLNAMISDTFDSMPSNNSSSIRIFTVPNKREHFVRGRRELLVKSASSNLQKWHATNEVTKKNMSTYQKISNEINIQIAIFF